MPLLCGSTSGRAVTLPQVRGDRLDRMVEEHQAAKVQFAVLRSVLGDARDIDNVASYEYSCAVKSVKVLTCSRWALIGLNH